MNYVFRLTALHENGLLELFTSVYGVNLPTERNDGGKKVLHIRGHPFMTSTRRGQGQAHVDACGRGGVKPHVDVHTEN